MKYSPQLSYTKSLLLSLFAALFIGTAANAQSLIHLTDATGINISASEEAELQTAADSLIAALPVAFRDSFKVYDCGFYLQQEHYLGGYPEVFGKLVEEVKSNSKYYFILGRSIGSSTKIFVDLELPTSGKFSCSNPLERKLEQIDFKFYADSLLNSNNALNTLIKVEELTIAYVTLNIKAHMECCDPGRSACDVCMSAKLIKNYFQSERYNGYMGQDTILAPAVINLNQNVKDYSGFALRFMAKPYYGSYLYFAQNYSDLCDAYKDLLPKQKIIITTNICNEADRQHFEEAKELMADTSYNYKGWIHVQKISDSSFILYYNVVQKFTAASQIPKFYYRINKSGEPQLGDFSSTAIKKIIQGIFLKNEMSYLKYSDTPPLNPTNLNYSKVDIVWDDEETKVWTDKTKLGYTDATTCKVRGKAIDLYLFNNPNTPGQDYDINGIYGNISGTEKSKNYMEYTLAHAATHELIHQLAAKSITAIQLNFSKYFIVHLKSHNKIDSQLEDDKSDFDFWYGQYKYKGFHYDNGINLMNTKSQLVKGDHVISDTLKNYETVPAIIKELLLDAAVAEAGYEFEDWLDMKNRYFKYGKILKEWKY